jgi:hypothetical protein
MAKGGKALQERSMSNRKEFGWVMLNFNLAAILTSLALGIWFGVYKPATYSLSSTTSLTGDVSRIRLSYFALLLPFLSS